MRGYMMINFCVDRVQTDDFFEKVNTQIKANAVISDEVKSAEEEARSKYEVEKTEEEADSAADHPLPPEEEKISYNVSILKKFLTTSILLFVFLVKLFRNSLRTNRF